MKRPMAYASLFFIFIITVLQLILGHAPKDYSQLDNRYCLVTGQLVRIETKKKEDVITTILFIKNPTLHDNQGQSISNTPETYIPRNNTIMCYMDNSYKPGLKLGSTVTISGKIHSFSHARNSGMFDAAKYYDYMHVVLPMYNSKLKNVCFSYSFKWTILDFLNQTRCNIGRLLDLCFNDEDSSILKTMLLGDKSSISSDIKNLYSQNGISHILAISGLHISMIGSGIYKILKKTGLHKNVCATTSFTIILLYGLMTGMAPSAVRAIIMFSFRMCSYILNRTYDATTAMTIAAVLILVEQPKYIFYSGFLFSFGAITAVIIILPLLREYFPKLIAANISINIVTLPIYLTNYYYFPIFSIILNLYIIPLMSLVIGGTIITLLICLIYIPVANIVSLPIHYILKIYEYSCKATEYISVGKMITGNPGMWQIVLYLTIVISVLVFRKKLCSLQVIMYLILAALVITLHVPTAPHITFIDVDQGDGIFICDGGCSGILIDGGSSSEENIGQKRIIPFLLSQGISELDAVFITHMDADHYNGIIELIDASGISAPRINKLILSLSAYRGNSEAFNLITSKANAKNIPVFYFECGDVYQSGKISLYCVYPDNSCTGYNTNEESLVLLLDLNTINAIFTGDLEGIGEKNICNYIQNDNMTFANGKTLSEIWRNDETTILKVAHHGSKNSTFEPFLEITKPALAIISAGQNNTYGHPHAETLERIKAYVPENRILRTDEYGQITIKKQGNKIVYQPYITKGNNKIFY